MWGSCGSWKEGSPYAPPLEGGAVGIACGIIVCTDGEGLVSEGELAAGDAHRD